MGSNAIKMSKARVGRKPSKNPLRTGLRDTTESIQPRPGCDEMDESVVREATKVTGMAQKITRAAVETMMMTRRMARLRNVSFMLPQWMSLVPAQMVDYIILY